MNAFTSERGITFPDVQAFVDRLNAMASGGGAPRGWLDPAETVVVARAPGRLDVMGGIADYSGSLVLEMPIAEAACVAVQRAREPVLDMVSLDPDGGGQRRVSVALGALGAGRAEGHGAARAWFTRDPAAHWASYVAGPVLVLMGERPLGWRGGLRILVRSEVPEAKGVSSSAALEVATMQAVAALFDIRLAPAELARLCQRAENLVVGAPCGIMDQITVASGRAGSLLALRCQPAIIEADVPVPDGIGLWGIDSGIRHAVSGADYASVRVGAFMGYRIIADVAGLPVTQADGTHVRIEDTRWGGYLANVLPSELARHFVDVLPETMDGAAFLERYGPTTDPVTTIDPDRSYAVHAATVHPIHEHFRVRAFARLLGRDPCAQTLLLLGELMRQAHASYGACGLGTAGTDRLVDLVTEAGPGAGLFGAKITGGGCGGTVAVLGRADAEGAVRQVAERYRGGTGPAPTVFAGSSPGSVSAGTFRLRASGE